MACNVLHKFFLRYFQEVLKNNNSSKEKHKVNNIFSHLHVTENIFFFLVSMHDSILEHDMNIFSIKEIYLMGGF